MSAFCASYNAVQGSLFLYNVDSLASLSCLCEVGSLSFDGTALEHINGLSSIQALIHPAGRIYIANNAHLKNILGLGGPMVVPNGLQIENNDRLNDVTGLHGIQSLGDCLWIGGNPLLAEADAEALFEAIGEANMPYAVIDGVTYK